MVLALWERETEIGVYLYVRVLSALLVQTATRERTKPVRKKILSPPRRPVSRVQAPELDLESESALVLLVYKESYSTYTDLRACA